MALTTRARWQDDVLVYEDEATGEALHVVAPVYFCEDFLAQSLSTDRHFTALDTGGATQTIEADEANGLLELALTATNEVQLAGISFNDNRPFRLNQGLVAEFRFRFSALPTGSVVACLGLCGDHNAAVNTVAESMWVRADGSGALTVETDDTVHETSLVATGVTLIANEWARARIVCENPASVRFYINGARVAGATTFNMSQVAALALQPVVRIGKESAATTVGTLEVDYVKVWQRRAA